jgi:hypothetical protein
VPSIWKSQVNHGRALKSLRAEGVNQTEEGLVTRILPLPIQHYYVFLETLPFDTTLGSIPTCLWLYTQFICSRLGFQFCTEHRLSNLIDIHSTVI